MPAQELEGRIEIKVENCEDFPTAGNPSVEDNVAKCGAYNNELKLICSKEILLQEATCEKNDVTQDNIIRDCVGDPNKVILENNIKVVKLNYSGGRLDIFSTHENRPIEESTSLSSENINHGPSEMEKHIPKDFIRDQTYRYPVRHEVSHNKKDLKKGDKDIKPTVTQQGGRPYVCRDCGKSYTQGSNLVIHQRKHTGERPFSCNECGKRFISRGNFATHKKIHTGEGTYICSDCGKSYVTRFHLVIHQRKHTGERPYTCNVCGKSFVSKSDLVRHEKVHQAYKPYNCSECGKRFTRSSDLVRHKKRHLESAVCK
ncbi:zinc finger protein 565-like [Bombina bombina]|uniref:zinc finger protein 565-like n=1 Tax=Bombina bombina TaxID=8345 RepID=UPI00235A7C64|nr:zinc finger protein 565-like [Bombina bombina]